jgi:hypothetical protein
VSEPIAEVKSRRSVVPAGSVTSRTAGCTTLVACSPADVTGAAIADADVSAAGTAAAVVAGPLPEAPAPGVAAAALGAGAALHEAHSPANASIVNHFIRPSNSPPTVQVRDTKPWMTGRFWPLHPGFNATRHSYCEISAVFGGAAWKASATV